MPFLFLSGSTGASAELGLFAERGQGGDPTTTVPAPLHTVLILAFLKEGRSWHRVVIDLSGRGAAREEVAQGTPTQSHILPSILVYED